MRYDRFLAAVLLAIVMFASIAPCADATGACDKPRNDFDGLSCLDKVYQHSDNDLNATFSRLHTKLDPPGQTLRTGQLAWLRTRNESCGKHEDTGFYVNLSCATRMTIARTQFLDDRYRACIGAGCMNSRLR